MSFIVDILVEFLLNIFAEGFVALAASFMPKRNLSKRAQNIISIVSCLIGAAMFVLLIVGIVLVVESSAGNIFGWIFIGICVAYIILAITLKIIYVVKKR